MVESQIMIQSELFSPSASNVTETPAAAFPTNDNVEPLSKRDRETLIVIRRKLLAFKKPLEQRKSELTVQRLHAVLAIGKGGPDFDGADFAKTHQQPVENLIADLEAVVAQLDALLDREHMHSLTTRVDVMLAGVELIKNVEEWQA